MRKVTMHDSWGCCRSYYYNIFFNFGAKHHKQLIEACHLLRFYKEVVRDTISANTRWGTVIRNFQNQWKALNEIKEEGVASTPKMSKTLEIIKQSEDFDKSLSRIVSTRNIPLSRVIRDSVEPIRSLPPLSPNSPN